ncbi:MAG TPA: methyltransferase domain-containing protein [Anaerolineaceae bacterium]|nr:methyltransferase domain-containing protein [Anaerolineaceae bacterium]HQH85337.1 methyltransferase domain-containing protein [Anaerolineaceae bacterium]
MTNFDSGTYGQFKREVIGVYDRAASLYDHVGTKQGVYYANRLVERLNIFPGARVLDVATGRGALLFAVAEKIGTTGYVLGIDLAPNMISETAAEIKARGLQQAEVLLMDADDVSYPNGSFDYILCGFAIHFLNYPRLLARFCNMLKPGGYIGTTHPYVPTHNEENFERWKWLFELTREVFPADFQPPTSWVAPNRLNRPELIEAALREAGFENISITTEEATMYFTDEQDWWDWEWSQASRFWLEGMSPEGLAKFKAVSFEKLMAMKTPKGIPILIGAMLSIANAPASR